MYRKISTLFFITIFFISSSYLFAQTFNDGFESGTFSPAIWNYSGNVSIVHNPTHSGNCAAEISSDHDLSMEFRSVYSGIIEWSFWVNIPQTNSNFNFHLVNSTGTFGVEVGIRKDGNFWALDGSNGNQPDVYDYSNWIHNWFKIKIIANINSKRYDFYINNKLVCQQWRFIGANGAISKASFNGRDWGTAYYDDVSIKIMQ